MFGCFMLLIEFGGGRGEVVVVMLFVLFEEVVKTFVVWSFYVMRRLSSEWVGVVYAFVVVAGFVVVELLFVLWVSGDVLWFGVMRSVVVVFVHLFFAGVWGYMFGGVEWDRFFGAIWFVAVFFHGVYDYVFFVCGSGLVVVFVFMFVMMMVGLIVLVCALIDDYLRLMVILLWEFLSVGQVCEVLFWCGRLFLLYWIVIGVFVIVGVTFVFFGVGVYLGH